MDFHIGEKYLLKLPPEWLQRESERPFHNKEVFLVKIIKSLEEVFDWPDCGTGVGEFTHAVFCPGLTTSYQGNVFLAKSKWLFSLEEKELYVSPFTGKKT